MEDAQGVELWPTISHLEQMTLKEWRQEKRPAVDLETAYRNDLSLIETKVQRYPNGSLWVTIECYTRHKHWDYQQIFTLQMIQKGVYKCERVV